MTQGTKSFSVHCRQWNLRLRSGGLDGISSFSSLTSFILVTRTENERNVVGELETNQFVMSASAATVPECTMHQVLTHAIKRNCLRGISLINSLQRVKYNTLRVSIRVPICSQVALSYSKFYDTMSLIVSGGKQQDFITSQ